MTTYHGLSVHKLKKFVAANGVSQRFGGLYVTDTFKRAMQYANAQATRCVPDAPTTALEELAVVVKLAVPDCKWRRRSESHHTLDKCEVSVENWNIEAIYIHKVFTEQKPGLRDLSQYIAELSKAFNIYFVE